MENTRIGMEKSSKVPFAFPSVRRRHLKSETYSTFVKILSYSYDHHLNAHSSSPQSQAGYHKNGLGQVFDKESNDLENFNQDNVEPKNASPQKNTTVVNREPEALGPSDNSSANAHAGMDLIDRTLTAEEKEDLPKHNNPLIGEENGNVGEYGDDSSLEQMVMKLRCIMEGNDDFAEDSSMVHLTSSDISDKHIICNQELSHLEEANTKDSGKCRKVDQQQVDVKNCSKKTSEVVNSLPDGRLMIGSAERGENFQCEGPILSTISVDVGNEMQQEVMEMDSSHFLKSVSSSLDHVAEGAEVEEGEIHVDSTEVDQSISKLFGEPVVLEEKNADGMQLSDDMNMKCVSYDGQGRTNENDSAYILCTSQTGVNLSSGRRMEVNKGFCEDLVHQSDWDVQGDHMLGKGADVKNSVAEDGGKQNKDGKTKEDVGCLSSHRSGLVFYGDILEQNIGENQEILTAEKQDAGISNKKKRGRLTEERKAKKKERKRKKRAAKNRQLGVKRLKLPPVTKPKAVTYCRHYLKGRCHEGEKCKFSHDTVPLTKSKPCCHFARHSCMKGNECPFDHDLSKYPCNNIVSKGFCSRGDDCMFSHKMLVKEDSSTTPTDNSRNSSFKQLNDGTTVNQSTKALPYIRRTQSCKNTEEKGAEALLEPSGEASKEICSFSIGKSSMSNSGKVKKRDSSPKSDDIARIRNDVDQSASKTTQKLNDVPKKLNMTLRGINFLSFGKTASQKTCVRELDGSPSKGNHNIDKQTYLSTNAEDDNKTRNLDTPSAASKVEKSNERSEISQPTGTPLGLNFLSLGKAPSDNFSRNEQTSMVSTSGNGAEGSPQEQNSSHKLNFTSVPWRLLQSPLTFGQSSSIAPSNHKNTPNSGQKSLLSALAFASKFEAQMKMKGTSDASALGSVASKRAK